MLLRTLHGSYSLAATALAVVLGGLAAAAPASAAELEAAPPPLASRCYHPALRAAPLWLRARDGARLYAVEAGRGPLAVVLVHTSGGEICDELPYAKTLVAAGIRVLALNLRGFGDSPWVDAAPRAFDRDLAAAVAHLRGSGARRVFLVGASLGGATVLTYGSTVPADGVVSLSGETRLDGYELNAAAAVGRLRAPLLILGSRHDRYLSVPDAVMLLRRAGSKDKRTALYPGGFHGWDLVDGAPYAARARALVLSWLRAHG